VLEARGRGLEPRPDCVYAHAALRPAEMRGDAMWLVGRPVANDEDDARTLVAAVAELERWGLTFALTYLSRGESILAVAGGADDRVTDTDAFFRDREPVLDPIALDPAAARTAVAVRAWTRDVATVLRAHPVNVRRAQEGRVPLNVITLKWWGRRTRTPPFAERAGLSGAILGASPFLAGLAGTLGLAFEEHGETDDPAADLERRLVRVAALLREGATFVLAHQKASDEAGHTKDPRAKLRVVERLDAAVARLAEPPFAGAVVCVTGDHATPACAEVIHSGDPVPLVVAGPGVRADEVVRFGELHQRRGILGHLRGEDVMPVLLNAADRPLFAGSRPVADAYAMGHPLAARPLELPPSS
jgi:2,3-bisphosphoglycerate-independent phosphoglycerate mutase